MTYEEQGVRKDLERAYRKLPPEKVAAAYDLLVEYIPKIAGVNMGTLPPTPGEVLADPDFTPRMRLVAETLDELFSGEEGRKIRIVLFTARVKMLVVSRQELERGEALEYGVDLFGPYRRLYAKKSRFRKAKLPKRTQLSFSELCFYTRDPERVYTGTYQLLEQAAASFVGKRAVVK